MIPIGEWVFLSVAINQPNNISYGFRYNPTANYFVDMTYGNRKLTSPDMYYALSASTQIYWGGSTNGDTCNCIMQYVRFYSDYVANSRDQMINLALMNPKSNLLVSN